jgi:hypothetical protein
MSPEHHQRGKRKCDAHQEQDQARNEVVCEPDCPRAIRATRPQRWVRAHDRQHAIGAGDGTPVAASKQPSQRIVAETSSDHFTPLCSLCRTLDSSTNVTVTVTVANGPKITSSPGHRASPRSIAMTELIERTARYRDPWTPAIARIVRR